jgi:transcriptional regulator GlxA family with amidase domain
MNLPSRGEIGHILTFPGDKVHGKYLLRLFILFWLVLPMMQGFSQTDYSKKNIAILIYDGVYLLDFAGPLEVFNDALAQDTLPMFNVCLVAPEKKSVLTNTNTRIEPNYSFHDCPNADIIVVPGGEPSLAKQNPAIGTWIIEKAKHAEIIMSVCTGAFILADLGLLDDQTATTWHGAVERLRKKYPRVRVLSNIRFTDNGKIITTAGVSAGIDGALHVIERLYGVDASLRTARYIEYSPAEK